MGKIALQLHFTDLSFIICIIILYYKYCQTIMYAAVIFLMHYRNLFCSVHNDIVQYINILDFKVCVCVCLNIYILRFLHFLYNFEY